MKQCQGGWCLARLNCAHYSAPPEFGAWPASLDPEHAIPPADRLCAPGDERPVLIGSDAPRPGDLSPDVKGWLRDVQALGNVLSEGSLFRARPSPLEGEAP